jgi:hypothetical protein
MPVRVSTDLEVSRGFEYFLRGYSALVALDLPGIDARSWSSTFAKFLAPWRYPHASQVPREDPESNVGDSPTLFATDRTDRSTFIAQGWKVTDPQLLADVGPIPDHEAIIEIPEDVLKFYVRKYKEEADH